MNVVGTGSPVMLTVRVRPGEVGVLRDVLCSRRAEVVSEAAVVGAKPRLGAACACTATLIGLDYAQNHAVG